MKKVYRCVMKLMQEDKPFSVQAPGIWLSLRKAEKLQRKGCDVKYKAGKVTIKRG